MFFQSVKTALVYAFFLVACHSMAQENTIDQGAIDVQSFPDSLIHDGLVIYMNPDEIAQFPGGNGQIKKYLAEHWDLFFCGPEFPIEGKCYLRFTVLSNGKITDITVLRGVPDCKECDKEAIRLVKGMPDWIPAKKAGVPVASYFQLPIRFVL